MQPSRVIRFSGCRVEIWDDARTLHTVFPDQSYVPAAPQDTPEYLARALDLGYGDQPDPAWAMCLEHEIGHTLLAETRGLLDSPTLRYVASGKQNRPAKVDEEEAGVLGLQALLNGRCGVDRLSALLNALSPNPEDLYGLVERAREVLRPEALCRGGASVTTDAQQQTTAAASEYAATYREG